ncbi:MAG: hypothetical protein IPG77_04860 [Betaproteobacteria bacterium]|nr:hypothetical protein [Betaproteobacteria bacterium]
MLERFPGLLLLSDAAIHALPGTIDKCASHVAEIDGLRYWLVLSGFGYEIDDPTVVSPVRDRAEPDDKAAKLFVTAQSGATADQDLAPSPRGWVESLATLDADLAVQARSVGIWDEVSYQQAESKLQFDSRQRLGLARFLLMSGVEPKADNLLDKLRHCPPWFVSMPLDRLRLTVRQKNVFLAHELSVVEDLSARGTNGLLQLPNMGRKSVNELAVALYQALLDGPPRIDKDVSDRDTDEPTSVFTQTHTLPPEDLPLVPSNAHSFKEELASAAQVLSANERGLLAARMGFNCRRMTLQEIADDIGVTRERVRQIETKVCKRLAHAGVWQHFEQRLMRLLEHRDAPLLLDGLPGLDAWFEGLPDLAEPFEFVFDRFLNRRLSVLAIDGVRYVSRLSWSEWESELRAARRMLEASVADQMLEADAKSLVESLLVGRGEELRGEIWTKAAEFARFAEREDGRRYLAAYGRSAEAVVHAILAGSPKPLHYSEIQRLSATYSTEPLDVRRAHAAAANVGILYERGTFGLLNHCPLTEPELAQVCADSEDLALEEHSQRQWHCSELCEDLIQRGLGFGGRLTAYVVNLALKDSTLLVNLGRMVWGIRDSWRAGTASRIDLRQAVVSVLQRRGEPLTTVEIRRALEVERGLSDHFQIFPVAPLVRLGEGKWGLIGRDTALDEAGLLHLAEILKRRIYQLGHGIHVSEVKRELEAALGSMLEDRFDAQWLLTVCKDAGMRVDRGQYYYLSDWEGPRRLTVGEAVDAALKDLNLEQGVSLDDLCARTFEFLKRTTSKMTISSALQSTQAVFDAKSGLWRRASREATSNELE